MRACRAALSVQADILDLAKMVDRRDRVLLQLRIGLNSGEVITGEIGSGPSAYTAIGEQVGMAQRMESAAPPGGVMVSESTARLVRSATVLGEPEQVRVKGAERPVPSRQLLGMSTLQRTTRMDLTFVGRQWEMDALRGILGRSMDGNGCVVGVAGPPGIGKSRIVREMATQARDAGVDVFTTYCEAHTTEVPFHAAAGLMRAAFAIDGLDDAPAQEQVRSRLPLADDEGLLLLDDFLGISDAAAALPQIDPDARRRRLAAMVNAAALSRTKPALFVVEDAHWIDEVSESMLAEFLVVVPRTPSLVLITYRPEYVGALARTPRSQTIALEPLNDSSIGNLTAEYLGTHPSVGDIGTIIATRASGNPFFAEEIVRDLVERGVLVGQRGAYVCAEQVGGVTVPSTLQAAIAARIDRLEPAAKRTLNAAAVIGSRFDSEIFNSLAISPELDALVSAEMIDQIAFTPRAEFVFRHPLIRTVAYESQLKSDRAKLHRRLAVTLAQEDQNAALIAEHYEAAGDLPAAYDKHMRAAEWSKNRDHAAAQLSWERARLVADALPVDHPDRMAIRIAPRTLLCGNAWRRFHPDMSARFDELRELCEEAGDKSSLAVGMAGLVMEHLHRARIVEGSRLASECMELAESIGDASLTAGLAFAACAVKLQAGEWMDVLRWSQRIIDLAGDNARMGNRLLGSPLAAALVFRGFARFSIGEPGWREDWDRAVSVARTTDPLSLATVIGYKYSALSRGTFLIDDTSLTEIDEAVQLAERSSDDVALVLVRIALGVALIERRGEQRERGLRVLRELIDLCTREGFGLNAVPGLELNVAWQKVGEGDVGGAIGLIRRLADEIFDTGNLVNCDAATYCLVGALLVRGAEPDIADAEAAIERLSGALPGLRWVSRDIFVLRLRAMVAHARGDEMFYREFRDLYRAMAAELGLEGHMAWAAAMP